MSVLSRYYELLIFVTIANGEVKEINPDTPYTIVYYQDSRMLSQSTGLIRGIIGEPKYIVTIPLDAEDVNYSTIINTSSIVSIDPYSFDAHFDDFNNWIGVEVAEHNCIQLRVKFVNAESIVMVEQDKTYEVGFISSGNGGRNYVTATGKVKSILRNTTKEAMPSHMNHFTNDTDYIIVFDFGEQFSSSIISVNVVDIRVIRPYIDPIKYSIELLNQLQLTVDTYKSFQIDWRDFTHRSYVKYEKALLQALTVLTTNQATITNNMIRDALDNLKAAYDGLHDTENEYDIIEYEKDGNVLLCNESIYPVIIKGAGNNCVEVIYYTNFGSSRHLHIDNSDTLEVVWSGYDPDRYPQCPPPDENIIAEVRKGIVHYIPESDLYPENCRLFIMNCNLHEVNLGMRVEYIDSNIGDKFLVAKFKNKLPLASPVVYIKGSEITDLRVSGYTLDSVSMYGNVTLKSCHIENVLIGGSSAVPFTETVQDYQYPYPNCFDTTIVIDDSTCDYVTCGGNETRTDKVTLEIIGATNIGYLNTGGIINSHTSAIKVNIKEMIETKGVPEIRDLYICSGKHNTVKNISIYSEGIIDCIMVGDITEESSCVIESLSPNPAVNIELAKGGIVSEIRRGYSNGELVPYDYVSTAYPAVLSDEFAIIEEPPTEEPPTEPAPIDPDLEDGYDI